ncbi:MAG: RHS repeat-associated core domain-containing protein [Bacteroides sp.]|nr:RHS repeat-associated core domain-containing protein [Bacteroides sp.]
MSQEDEEKEYRLYHSNHLGSTTLITDEAGKVVETFEYNPYGELLDGEIGKYPFLFNGEYGVVTDSNGLYYMRARYYNVDIKRFMNQDIIVGSVESSPSLNRYAYVEGNPVNYLDPFGLEKWGGEHDFLHQLLGELSYSFSKIGIVAWFIPLLTPITYVGGLISIWDSELHYEEIQYYDVDDKYYRSHCISIGVNLISAIPYLGPVFYFIYYWLNKGEKMIYKQEVPDILADGYIFNKELEDMGSERLPLYYYLFYPVSEFYFSPQYGGRH